MPIKRFVDLAGHRTAVLVAGSLLALLFALVAGSGGPMSPVDLLQAPARDGDELPRVVLMLRLARALSGFAVGGLLALAGAIAQALLRNPLADPYVLGVSGGAAFVAVLALWLGAGALGVQIGAIAGALGALTLLWLLTRAAFARPVGDGAVTAVLLTGAMIASFFGALLGLALSLAPDGRLRPIIFWLLGDLAAAADVSTAAVALALLGLLLVVARRDGPALNRLLHGAAQAYTQGVDVGRVRWRLIAIAAVATGCAVTLSGAIGFVGFVAPHLARRLGGSDQVRLLPASVLVGGILVTIADTAARTVVAPLQLPVGVVTALIGVPVFVWVLRRWP